MKKIASISILAVASALSASAATVLFDFNSSLLPEGGASTVSTTDDATGFKASLTTSSGNLGSKSSGNTDWTTDSTSFSTSALESFVDNEVSFNNSWQTFISGAKGGSLTLTVSGLVAGETYQIALVTGCPFEGQGAWNSLITSTSNTYTSASPNIGENTQTIEARKPTGYTISDIVANEDGEITLTVKSPGSHTPTFNALAISGATASVPEPATATLSLLGLAALMVRRRRA